MATSTNTLRPMRVKGNAEEPRELDPVCGAEVPRATAPAETYFEDQHFYFCSTDCKEAFEREPSRYCVSCVEVL